MYGMATESERARFGRTLKKTREGSGKTQREVVEALNAQRIQITQPSYGDWELGRSAPRRSTVVALEDILDAKGILLSALGYAPVTGEDWAMLLERIEALERARNADGDGDGGGSTPPRRKSPTKRPSS